MQRQSALHRSASWIISWEVPAIWIQECSMLLTFTMTPWHWILSYLHGSPRLLCVAISTCIYKNTSFQSTSVTDTYILHIVTLLLPCRMQKPCTYSSGVGCDASFGSFDPIRVSRPGSPGFSSRCQVAWDFYCFCFQGIYRPKDSCSCNRTPRGHRPHEGKTRLCNIIISDLESQNPLIAQNNRRRTNQSIRGTHRAVGWWIFQISPHLVPTLVCWISPLGWDGILQVQKYLLLRGKGSSSRRTKYIN